MPAKERITFSLSKRTADFLRHYQTQTRADSLSALLESIIARELRHNELRQLNARVSKYYDSLSDQECQDNAAWGELGEAELAHVQR